MDIGAGAVVWMGGLTVLAALAWIATGSVYVAWLRNRGGGTGRSWGLVAAACSSLAIGQTYLLATHVLGFADGRTAALSLTALSATVAVLLVLALSDARPPRRSTRLGRIGWLLDALGFAALAVLPAATMLYPHRFARPGEALVEALDVPYVLAGVALLGVSALTLLGAVGGTSTPAKRMLAAGGAAYGCAVVLWPSVRANLQTPGPEWAELGLTALHAACFCAVFTAGRRAVPERTTPETRGPRPIPMDPRSLFEETLAPTVLLAAIPLLAAEAAWAAEGSTQEYVSLAVMSLIGLVLALRMCAGAIEAGTARKRIGTDPLTGVIGARGLHARVEEAVRDHGWHGHPVSVVVAGLNDFQRIKTLYGRDEGDRVLVRIAQSLRGAAGRDAVVSRAGSETFAVVFEGLDGSRGLAKAAELRQALGSVTTRAGLPITVSLGIATCPKDSCRPHDLLARAYSAQLWARSHGWDTPVAYDPVVVDLPDVRARLSTAEERAELDMLLAISLASEDRHEATRYHSRNVAALAVRVGTHLGMSPPELRDIEVAALLHDIGKVSIPDETLMKRAPRTRAEETRYREHVSVGAAIVGASRLRRVSPSVRSHHERWDGTGYPDMLAGEAIPLAARIIAACDAFEGMVAGRPDRPALSAGAALQELDLNLGSAFEPHVGEALIAVVAEETVVRWPVE